MARIPIFPPTYVTLTQVFPYVQVVNGSTPEVDVNGHFLPMSYQNTSTPLTVFHQIACIGFGGLKKELESNQVTGQEIKAEISANINQL